MDTKGNSNTKTREHLSNERTFLSWVRTSIALMGFGFVIVRFAFFLRQISLVINEKLMVEQTNYSAILGISLVALGMFISLLAFSKYRQIEKQIATDSYLHATYLPLFFDACHCYRWSTDHRLPAAHLTQNSNLGGCNLVVERSRNHHNENPGG